MLHGDKNLPKNNIQDDSQERESDADETWQARDVAFL